jgi:hypothetical protein
VRTIVLLTVSNIFMTFAWYGHLKYRSEALWKAILASWGIAFFEYCFPSSGKPYRLVRIHHRSAQDHPGSDHLIGVFCFFHLVPWGKTEVELCSLPALRSPYSSCSTNGEPGQTIR